MIRMESGKEVIDDLARDIYVASVSNKACVNSEHGAAIASDSYRLAEIFLDVKSKRNVRSLSSATTSPTNAVVEVNAFDAEFRNHLQCAKHPGVHVFYVKAIKFAAMGRYVDERLNDLVPIKNSSRAAWVADAFADFLIDAIAGYGFCQTPIERVATDIEHAMLVMYPKKK